MQKDLIGSPFASKRQLIVGDFIQTANARGFTGHNRYHFGVYVADKGDVFYLVTLELTLAINGIQGGYVNGQPDVHATTVDSRPASYASPGLDVGTVPADVAATSMSWV